MPIGFAPPALLAALLRELGPIPGHDFAMSARCHFCGVTQEEVENNLAPKHCLMRRKFERDQQPRGGMP